MPFLARVPDASRHCPDLTRHVQDIIQIQQIIVVASGCNDRTVPIVQACAHKDSRIKLIEQAQRQGKASAINLFLRG